MSRRHQREIERRLRRMPAELPAAEPPAGLLERLRAEIPEDLGERLRAGAETEDGEGGSRGRLDPVVPFPSRRWLAAAAMLVMLVGGGFLTWKLTGSVTPLDRHLMDGAAAPAAERGESAGEAAEASPGATVDPDADAEPADAAAGRPVRQSEPEAQRLEPEALDAARSVASRRGGEELARRPERRSMEAERLDEVRVRERRGAAEEPEHDAGARQPVDERLEEGAAEGGEFAPEAAEATAAPAPPAPPAPRTAAEARPQAKERSIAAGAAEGASRPVAAPSPPAAAEKRDEVEDRAAAGGPVGRAPAAAGAPPRADEAASGALTVRVLSEDEEGGELPGVTVELEGEGVRRLATTDAGGEARFSGLRPGRYRVRASLTGFSTVTGHVTVSAEGGAAVVELRLALAYVAEEIVVTARPRWRLGRAKKVPASAAPEESRVQHAPPPPPEAVEDLLFDVPGRETPVPPVHGEVATADDRLSTFGLDVDTGSYTLLRAHLEAGEVPPPEAVRVEEVVNAQRYEDPFAARPAGGGEVFRLLADGAPSPFAPGPQHRLLRFRIATPDLAAAARKPVVLTLVVDVSGSMAGEKLELVKRGLRTLLNGLRPDDRVALVVFSDGARLAAPHGEPAALARAAGELSTEGGTNAEAGLRLGYEVARQAFDPGAANRVMLLSDGVANVGATGPRAMLRRVAAEAAEGIELTTVGVGMGEFNDEMLETLADRGDGRYAYVDDRREIDRLFSGELDGTLHTVAEEARAQVEFDPRVVETWRQLGYENRAIADHEFRYDSVDAGEIGPGHSVTVLYEVKLRGTPEPGRPIALLKLRWRDPAAADGTPGRYRELEQRLLPEDLASTWAAAAPDLRLAAVAAELAEQLRRSPHADSSPTTLLTESRRLAPQAPELAALAHKWSDLSPSPQP